jgi:hypothetical protein
MLLGKDLKKALKDHTWKFLIFSAWLISNFSAKIGEDLATRLYFILLALVFIIISTPLRNKDWITHAFWELSIYNLIDELLNAGDKYSDWELPILIFALVSSYIKFNKRMTEFLLSIKAKVILEIVIFLLFGWYFRYNYQDFSIHLNKFSDNLQDLIHDKAEYISGGITYVLSMASLNIHLGTNGSTLLIKLLSGMISLGFTLVVVIATHFLKKYLDKKYGSKKD